MYYFFAIMLLFSSLVSAQEKQAITLYFYHAKPPLVINPLTEQGLYYDLTRYLNSHSANLAFEAVFVPRKRIERLLHDGKLNGVLLGVNPIWFNDKNEETYLWTHHVLTDRDEIVSLASSPIEYLGPASLKGKVFGGVRGFYYFGINELVDKQEIERVETVKEVNLFYLLLNKRIESAVISRSTFDYLMKKNDWRKLFYLSKKPHDIYDRRILVPKTYRPIFDELDAMVKKLPYDKAWLKTLSQYR